MQKFHSFLQNYSQKHWAYSLSPYVNLQSIQLQPHLQLLHRAATMHHNITVSESSHNLQATSRIVHITTNTTQQEKLALVKEWTKHQRVTFLRNSQQNFIFSFTNNNKFVSSSNNRNLRRTDLIPNSAHIQTPTQHRFIFFTRKTMSTQLHRKHTS